MKNCWASIDPGLGGTGVAVWRNEPRRFTPQGALLKSFSVGPYLNDNWVESANELGMAIQGALYFNARYEPQKMYFELPALMGMAAARRGDLVKLTIAAGVIVGWFGSCYRSTCIPVPVVEWKGQLPKELCNERVRKIMGWNKKDGRTTHELDAVGIGLHIQGLFK